MRVLPIFLKTPARVMVAAIFIVVAGELLIMALIESLHDTILKYSSLEKLVLYLDPIALTAIVTPALYFLIYRPLSRQSEIERQLGLITERVRVENRLVESERHFRAVTETANDAIITGSSKGDVVGWNPAAERMFGYAEAEIIDRPLTTLMPERFRKQHSEGMARVLAGGTQRLMGRTTESVGLRKDGSEFPLELSLSQWQTAEGKFFNAIIRDITERRRAEEVIHKLAFYDELTQIPNRRLLNDRLKLAMASSKRSGRYGAVMFLDLDNFKPLNDKYGHGAGDRLLIEVARRITGCLREMDTVARFGGDEFVVMLCELDADKAASTEQVGKVAEKIRTVLSEPYRLTIRQESGTETILEHRCTASIGAVLFVRQETDMEDLIKWADLAMYQAKDAGRNSVRFYEVQD